MNPELKKQQHHIQRSPMRPPRLAWLLVSILTVGVASSRPLTAQQQVTAFGRGLLAMSNVFFDDNSDKGNRFGPGDVVTVSGVVPYIPYCPSMAFYEGRGEWISLFPSMDLYVIPDGTTLLPLGKLEDVSEAPNRVTAFSSGAFIDEIVAIVQPAGNLGPGRYDIVMDQCLDGHFDPGFDLVLGEGVSFAFEVIVPGPLPALDLHPIKKDAAVYVSLLKGGKIEAPPDLLLPPVEIPGFCKLFDELKKKANLKDGSMLSAWAGIATDGCEDLTVHWDGIAHDPPDPNFTQFAELGDLSYQFGPAATPLEQAMRTLALVMAEHAAESRALLTSLERFQGAQQAGNDEYTVLQLEEANKFITLMIGPGGSLLRFYAALEAFDIALRGDPLGGLPEAAALRAFIPSMRQGLGGIFKTLGPDFQLKKSNSRTIIVPTGLQAWLIVYLGLEPLLATEGLPGVLQVRAAAGLPPITFRHPIGNSTGAYIASPGREVHFDAGRSTDPNGDALTFAWDLDADGAFDDAAGVTVDYAFAEAGTRLVAVKATDPAGNTDVHYTLVKIGDIDNQDIVAAGLNGELYHIRPDGTADMLRASQGVAFDRGALHVDLNGDIFLLSVFRGNTLETRDVLERFDASGNLRSRITRDQLAALIDVPLWGLNDFALDGRGDILLVATERIPGPVRTIVAGFNAVVPGTIGRGLLVRLAKDGSRASVIAYIHQEYVSKQVINGELVVTYTMAYNGSEDPALAIDLDGNVVVGAVNNLVTDRVHGIFKYDPDTGAATTISPGNHISGFAIDEFYYPTFGGAGACARGVLFDSRFRGGIEVDARGDLINELDCSNLVTLFRVFMPPQITPQPHLLSFGVEGVPLAVPWINSKDVAIGRGGDYFISAVGFNPTVPSGVYRVTPAGEVFVHSWFPEPNAAPRALVGTSVLDVLPDVRAVTPKDVRTPPPLALRDLDVEQQGCPGSAQLRVSVVNPSDAGVNEPIRVYFYNGDPEAGGVLIASGVTTGPIPANGSSEVTAPWLAPSAGAHEVFAISLGAGRAQSRAVMVCLPVPEDGNAIRLTPTSATSDLGTSRAVQAVLKDLLGHPIASVPITFNVSGTNTATGAATTDATGTASFTYRGAHAGVDTVAASAPHGGTSNSVSVEWIAVNLDATAPVIMGSLSSPPNAAGWHNAAVVVSWSVVDPESGIASSTDCAPVTIAFETPGLTVTCSATNGAGLVSTQSVLVKLDKTPPRAACDVTPRTIWPPNHKLIGVTAHVESSDFRSGLQSVILVRASSNEPDNGQGDGDTRDDIQGFAIGTASFRGWLRAERSGNGSGRVYTLEYEATDLAGNRGRCAATVVVPHHR